MTSQIIYVWTNLFHRLSPNHPIYHSGNTLALLLVSVTFYISTFIPTKNWWRHPEKLLDKYCLLCGLLLGTLQLKTVDANTVQIFNFEFKTCASHVQFFVYFSTYLSKTPCTNSLCEIFKKTCLRQALQNNFLNEFGTLFSI